jgi:hypothetical protein
MPSRYLPITVAGVEYELRHHDESCECAWWTVIAAHTYKNDHRNPEQYVGLEFRKGDEPHLRPVGHAQSIQRGLNRAT